jgi:cytochrome c-type biogenesis protein CcmH
MMVFWGVVALLLLGALLMLLPSLWKPRWPSGAVQAAEVSLAVYRDQIGEADRDLAAGLLPPGQLGQVREDIQRRLLEETAATQVATTAAAPARRTAWALALLLPLASVLTYLSLGDPTAIGDAVQPPGQATSAPAGNHSVTAGQIEGMVTNLAQRLQTQPDDAEGWMMLGRSYTALGRYPDAVIAFRRAVALVPGDATLLSDFADVLGMAQGKRLAGEPAQMVQKALDIDPNHVKALALAGSVAFEVRDYATARAYWERLIAAVPADSDLARSVRGSVAQAIQLEAGAGEAQAPVAVGAVVSPAAPASPAVGAGALAGEVRIAPALASQVAPGDTLFVFARAVQGPRMPLAIFRQPVGAWPRAFTLDDSMAMAPELRLSGFGQVTVSARISRSGDATPRSGDLVGQAGPVAPGAGGLVIVIDRVQP